MTKFREMTSEKGTLILAGKNAENNEELIAQAGKNEEVFHTAAPGSPFVNIKGAPKPGDIQEAAIFCARYSQDYRDNKSNVIVHRFLGKDIYKKKDMEKGTFGLKKYKKMVVKKEKIEKLK